MKIAGISALGAVRVSPCPVNFQVAGVVSGRSSTRCEGRELRGGVGYYG